MSALISKKALTLVRALTATYSAFVAALAASGGANLIGWIQAGAGAVQRTIFDKLRDSISARDFGARPESADNTAAINAALAAAGALVQNTTDGSGSIVSNEVFLPAGVYACQGNIFVPEGVRLRGASRSSSVLKFTTANTGVQMGDTANINGTTYKANIVVQDLCIYTTVPSSTSIGILAVNCIRQSAIRGCQVYGFGKNIELSNSASWAFAVEDCFLHDAGVNHIYAEACNTLMFRLLRCDTAGADGIFVNGSTNANQPLDLVFNLCIVQGSQYNGVKLLDAYQAAFYDCDMEGNNLAAASAYADIQVMKGAQNRTCQVLRVHGGFFSAGASPNITHRIVDVRDTAVFHASGVISSGGVNNYDRGFLLSETVSSAFIDSNVFNGCTNEVDFAAAATKMFWRNSTGDVVIGDSRLAAALLDAQQARANANLASLYNTSNVAGSVALQLRTGGTAGATYALWALNGAGANVARLSDDGKLAVLKVQPGTDAGGIQTANGLYMTTGVPSNANGANGDFCFRVDGAGGSSLYQKAAGAWVARA